MTSDEIIIKYKHQDSVGEYVRMLPILFCIITLFPTTSRKSNLSMNSCDGFCG